jgi:tetratricopeptide (TPR) repeat protein
MTKSKSAILINSKLQKALQLQQDGQFLEAERCYRYVLNINPKSTLALENLAIIANKTGRINLAITTTQKLLSLKPNDEATHNFLGTLYLTEGNFSLARKYFKKTLKLSPNHHWAFFNIGESYRLQNLNKKAMLYYEKAIVVKPDLGIAYYFWADLLEKSNKIDLAWEKLNKAKELSFEWRDCLLLESKLLYRMGEINKALKKLSEIEISENDTYEAACQVLFLRGKFYDRLGITDKAFYNFKKCNQQFSRSREASQVDAQRYLEGVLARNHKFSPKWVDSWVPLSENKNNDPVFIVGFPRSGTTLLDQILDSHPQINVLEEKPIIETLVSQVNKLPLGYPAALSSLTSQQVEILRNQYFHFVSDFLKAYDNKHVLVDKFPLNLIDLGLIVRLFPNAKIIFAMRHPVDVCLSNFMQFYILTDAMANFLTLEGTAKFYTSTMDLWDNYRNSLDFNYHQVKYENIIDNLESEAQAIISFLGLQWNQRVLDYHKHVTSSQKTITTPSYQDVSEPIYSRARYRWKRYRKFLAPILNLLEPYVERYGYSL